MLMTPEELRVEVEGKNTKVEEINEKDIDLDIPDRAPLRPPVVASNNGRWTSRQLAQKIIQFAEVLSGTKLFPYQKNFGFRVACSVIDNDGETLTALFSRQSGKTETVSCVVPSLMILLPRLGSLPHAIDFLPITMFDEYGQYLYRDGFWVGVFAPIREQSQTTYDRLRRRMMNQEALAILRSPDFRYTVDVSNGNTTTLSNGSVATCHTASDTANIESKTYHLIIIEECQDVSDFKINKCVTGDTLITLLDGRRVPVKDAKKGDVTLALDEKSWKLVPSKIREVHVNGMKDVFEIETASGAKIRTTANHQFMTFRRGHKTIKKTTLDQIDITKDRIMLAKNNTIFGNKSVGVPLSKIIGYILGDGCTRGNNIAFCAIETEIKEDFEKACKEYGMPATLRTHVICSDLSLLAEYQISVKRDGLGTRENKLISKFKEMGIWNTLGFDKRIPSVMFEAPKEEIAAMLGSLFACDGCASIYVDNSNGRTRGSLTYASISRGLIDDMRDLLIRFNVVSRVSERENKKGFGKGNGKNLFTLSIQDAKSLKNFAKQIFIPSKQHNVIRAAELSEDRGSRTVINHQIKSAVDDADVFFDRIKSIKPVGKEQTYCITVAHDGHITRFGLFVTPQSIAPMAAATNGTKCFVGTPNNKKGAFLEQILINKQEAADEGKKNHLEYDYRVGAKYNRRYAAYVLKEKKRLGFDSDEFKMAYRLIWILERGMFTTYEVLIGDADKGDFNKCAKDYEIYFDPKPGKIYVAGLDVAKESDSTVLTILEVDFDNPVLTEESTSAHGDIQVFKQYNKRLACWMELQGNWETQYGTIKEMLDHFGIFVLYIDSTGVGDPLSDRLTVNLPDVLVVSYKFSKPSKSVMWKNLSQEVSSGRLEFPYGLKARRDQRTKRFVNEVLGLEKSYQGQYMVCEHPAVRGAHDDYPDSLALACMAAKEEGMPEIEVTDSSSLYG